MKPQEGEKVIIGIQSTGKSNTNIIVSWQFQMVMFIRQPTGDTFYRAPGSHFHNTKKQKQMMQGSPCIITDQPNGEQAFDSSCEPQTQLAIAINLQGGKQTINARKAGDDDNTMRAVTTQLAMTMVTYPLY